MGQDGLILYFPVYRYLIYFELKPEIFVISKRVSNREICFIKVVIFFRENMHFSLNFT